MADPLGRVLLRRGEGAMINVRALIPVFQGMLATKEDHEAVRAPISHIDACNLDVSSRKHYRCLTAWRIISLIWWTRRP